MGVGVASLVPRLGSMRAGQSSMRWEGEACALGSRQALGTDGSAPSPCRLYSLETHQGPSVPCGWEWGWGVPVEFQGPVRGPSLGVRQPDSGLAVQPQAHHLTSLSLSFPFGTWAS